MGFSTRGVCWIVIGLCLAFTATLAEEAPPEAAPWLGVRMSAPERGQEGIRIQRIFNGSPADKAGLRAGDLIKEFGGEPVNNLRELVNRIRAQEKDAWVPMTVERQGDELLLDARLTDRPERIDAGDMRRGWIGVSAINLPDSLREHFGAPTGSGVMISEVVPGSPAEAAGFRLGDVIYEIGERTVRSNRALREIIAGGGVGNDYEFFAARDGVLLELEARIDAEPPRER
jgi:serine protease Do